MLSDHVFFSSSSRSLACRRGRRAAESDGCGGHGSCLGSPLKLSPLTTREKSRPLGRHRSRVRGDPAEQEHPLWGASRFRGIKTSRNPGPSSAGIKTEILVWETDE